MKVEIVKNNSKMILESNNSEKIKSYIFENFNDVSSVKILNELYDSNEISDKLSQREQECWELGFDEAYNNLPTRRPIWNDDKLLNAYKAGFRAGETKRRLHER